VSKIESELVVAIVGMGPRGLSILERLLIRLAEREGPTVRIWVFDPGEHGAGRIWRTDQPDWFMMNTPTGEVSMYSGGPDEGPPRAGSGPSLHEWISGHADSRWSALDESGYAPRSLYGQYLRDVFDSLVAHRPDNVTIHPVRARVARIVRHEDKMLLVTDSGRITIVDKVVLTTGHPTNIPNQWEQKFLDYADGRSDLLYIRGDSAADMDLTSVGVGELVGILGLGLTFFDVVMALTVGRSGVFETEPSGRLRYQPSGREPRIFAGSRSGLPMLARGLNQKAPKYRYQPRFLTKSAIATARRRAWRETGSAQLNFRLDVLPLLKLEVEHVYYTTLVRNRVGGLAADRFARRHLISAGLKLPDAVKKLLAEFGIADAAPIDLERMARPFSDLRYEDTAEFHRHVLRLLRLDLAEALQGNVYGPIKAALDILRDTRGAVRAAVDFGGLRPESHRDDFLGWFNPINTMLSAGPPAIRVAQVCALIEAGLLCLVGPATEVSCDQGGAGFVLASAQVGGSRQIVTTLIDARIPRPSVRLDCSPLTRQLLADGLISEYVNVDPVTEDGFATEAVSATRAPFHVVDTDGRPNPDMYVLGIPTENQRWFTQIGNGRPGPLSGFHADADAIARDVLASLSVTVGIAVPAENELAAVGDNASCNFTSVNS
jgi:FAD-NAD(P)-binding protein